MQKSEVIELKHPIERDGSKIEKLVMRGPKVRDLISAEKAGPSDSEREVYLLSDLCDVDEDVIKDLCLVDYTGLQKVYQNFLS